MKQFTIVKVLVFSALYLANFSAFAMEDNRSINEELYQAILNYDTFDAIVKIGALLDQGGDPIGVLECS